MEFRVLYLDEESYEEAKAKAHKTVQVNRKNY